MSMSETELLEQIEQKKKYVERLSKDPHQSSQDLKLIAQQQARIEDLEKQLKALKNGKTLETECVCFTAEEAQRGKAAKDNPVFPTMCNKGRTNPRKSHKPILDPHIVVAEGCTVQIR